ncbi:MAG: DUF1573 domain-containing protein [Chitinophagales bacterium]|nr:DUF1573 domain-containing protein [Chitinophagales bacterium]
MKSLVTVLMICCTVNFLQAQSAKATASPVSWLSGTSHDFGRILQNTPASYIFEFSNTGKDPVTITRVQPSCSCTALDYTREEILPGKKGLIKISYNAHTAGMFNKTITVTTDPGSDNTILTITGEVVQKAEQVRKPQ